MPREYASASRPRSVIERGIRNAVKQGTLSTGDVRVLNVRRRARGLPAFDIDGVKAPPDEVVELRRREATAKTTAMLARSKKKPAARPAAKPAATLATAKARASSAIAKANASIARSKKK